MDCPRNTDLYNVRSCTCQRTKIVFIILSQYNLIGTIFSAFYGNFSLFMRLSSNENSKSGLDDAILDQN